MSTLLWIVVAVAIIFLIIGGTVKAVSFLLWIAPILLIVAVVMFLLNRSRGRRGV
jgi:cytochrome c-type biogenesis protein CcmH/NrfF